MKKYYIPTSSLNFNNILSTESISPKIFYDRREFGYTRWFTVEENEIEEVTLLYSTPHIFACKDSDLEDHPMLIEINTDEEFKQISEDVFYTNKTIYLNPWDTIFHFFLEKVKLTVLSMSESSLETKTVRLYEKKMKVSTFEGEYEKVEFMSVRPSDNEVAQYIEKDYILNKMKGLLYGYYIGANLSMSSDLVNQLTTLREVQSIFLSIRSSQDKQPSQSQRKRLEELFLEIEHCHPIYRKIKQEFNNENANLIDRIFIFFKKESHIIFNEKNVNDLLTQLGTDADSNSSLSWIEEEIAKKNREIISNKQRLDPDKAEIIVSPQDRLVSQKIIDDELMSKLMRHWVNDVFCSRSFDGNVSSKREQLSDEITKKAKEIIGNTWDASSVRTYLNQLRRHVRGEVFDQPWDNGLLSSTAAVLIKGDDWESMLHFMQSKGMHDYRLAFAIYGVLNGFANMTRDFTDNLLNEESNYLKRVYREFYGQLHEKDIQGIIERVEQSKNLTPSNTHRSQVEYPTSNIRNEWADEIRQYAEGVIKRDKKKLLCSLDDALSQNGKNRNYHIFFDMLAQFDGWSTANKRPSEALKRMKEHFLSKDEATEGTLFYNHVTQPAQTFQKSNADILSDLRWIDSCALLINNPKAKKQFIEDAEWFTENHNEWYNDKKKGKQKGRYYGHGRSNVEVKERFEAYLRKKAENNHEKMGWLVKLYKEIPIDRILVEISRMYDI